ncbi:hypothetical protein DICVIV_04156 [Dictyocaulus viviparus]|uniref:Major facilitator superfamily (MFS) profile domain-containing protein n=1 Tax=Dictyocaulus viviparus TaxID=29172 RepID=A0A0D8Y0W8_DICVI|nr:hypothetical protein DICVIV_04156 [Dictyocaulus viviparus]
MVFAGSAPQVSCNHQNGTIYNVCKSRMNLTDLTECDLEISERRKGRWVKSSISVQMCGVLVGTLFFGAISDHYGRKSGVLLRCPVTIKMARYTMFARVISERRKGRWVKSSISVQMCGVLVGTLFFGAISDHYGRKSAVE